MIKYPLSEYFNLLQASDVIVDYNLKNKGAMEVENLTFNSKEVTEGTLFICKGAGFKAEYLNEAIKDGAIAYISETKYDIEEDIPYILVKDIRKAMPPLAELFTNKAWEKLNIVGFGGTKGKSTSAYYMKAVVDDYMVAINGKESAILSSVETYDGIIKEESHLTTPESVVLHQHFANAVASDISFLEMEISSQALKYNRIDNMKLDVGIFLNISEDHISPVEHPDFDDYLNAKLKIFESSKYAVINLDSDFIDEILNAAKASEKIITFSTKNPKADVYAYNIHKENNETVFTVKTDKFDEDFKLTMPGFFNVENALAVIATSLLLNIPKKYIHSGLYRARTAGRMELFTSKDKNIIAVVDYAHNKLSFEKLFSSVKDEYSDYNIVAVFGCPGGKALNRREELGTIAGKYSTKVYITEDDPGKESFENICNSIAQTVKKQNCPYEIIDHRGDAIKKAFIEAKDKTIILITGKGNEETIKRGTKWIPCTSDVQYVTQFMAKYDKTH